MNKYLKKHYLYSILIILSVITAVILSGCGGGEENLGINSTPPSLPTQHPAGDPFYDNISMQIGAQKFKWKKELNSPEEAVKKTVNWLKGNITDIPVPQEIKDNIANAEIDYYDGDTMWIYYKDGTKVVLYDEKPWLFSNSSNSSQNKRLSQELSSVIPGNNNQKNTNNMQKATTVKNSKILILAPFDWTKYNSSFESGTMKKQISRYVVNDFKQAGYDVTCKAMQSMYRQELPRNSVPQVDFALNSNVDVTFGYSDYDDDILENYPYLRVVHFRVNQLRTNIVRPEDFENMDQYGVIYIASHGGDYSIEPCLYYDNDPVLNKWLNSHKDLWYYGYQDYPDESEFRGVYYDKKPEVYRAFKTIGFERKFFENMKFNNSIVFMNTCKSMKLLNIYYYYNGNLEYYGGTPIFSETPIFTDAKAYIGYTDNADQDWSIALSYYFFRYLMYGYERPDDVTLKFCGINSTHSDPSFVKADIPMSVKEAITVFDYFGLNENYNIIKNHECSIDIKTSTDEEIYLPAKLEIIVNKR